MECVACGGGGCGACNETGRERIEQCPLEIITEDVWRVIKFAELYEKGLPPIAGGALDQAHNFIEASLIVFNETQYWKKKLGIFD